MSTLQLSDRFESDAIARLLSNALPYYLSAWRDVDDQTGLFGSEEPGCFNMSSIRYSSPVIEYVVRPHLQVLCILATFLSKPEYARHLEQHVPVERARTMLHKGLTWACQTHLTGSRDVAPFLVRKRWGENWRSSLWASLMGLCVQVAGSQLSSELVSNVKHVIAFEADRFVGVSPPSGCEVDTKLEENAQDTMVLAWAINLNPTHPHVTGWEQALGIWAVNIASNVEDKADHSEYRGGSIASFISTQNLYVDRTAENHGFFHPELLSYTTWVVLAMASYSLNGREPPQCLRRRSHEETFDVLLPFCLPSGIIYAPAGQDLPLFVPRPFALAWGLWNNDPRALRLTEKLLAWMDETLAARRSEGGVPWVLGFEPSHEGWELFFQSLVGFELSMLVTLPFPKEFRFYSSGQIESAVDTKRIYPYVELCYRRNTRASRSVAWKTLDHHPIIGLNLHDYSELLAPHKAALLGIPALSNPAKRWRVAFHNEHPQRDGFETWGRVFYYDSSKNPLLRRDMRVLTWGDDGLVVLDEVVAEQDVHVEEQYLSPIYIVNDHWTKRQLNLTSGSLRESFPSEQDKTREVSCPSFWASVENILLVQFLWGRTKGLAYVPAGERNAPAYWKNCRLDMIAVHVDAKAVRAGESAYRIGFFIGAGKGPRPFKCTGEAGEFFRGLVIMDGKNTQGID